MKVNNLFLVGVAALSLGMTACNNEDVPQVNNPGEGTTFAGMYISWHCCLTRVPFPPILQQLRIRHMVVQLPQ